MQPSHGVPNVLALADPVLRQDARSVLVMPFLLQIKSVLRAET
jgi:hypothetical protein